MDTSSTSSLPQLGSDSAIAKPNQLCGKCRGIFDLEKRFIDTGAHPSSPPESWVHHHHEGELAQSASEGCHLCSLILYALQRKENIKFADDVGRMAPKPNPNFARLIMLGIKTPSEGRGVIAIIAPPSDNGPFSNTASYIHYDQKDDSQYNQKVDTNTYSKRTISLVRDWINECKSKHEFCRDDISKKARERDNYHLPTRLLSIRDQEGALSIRLIETRDLPIESEYVALSYRWSTQSIVRLTTSRKALFASNIDIETLPKSILHAIALSNELGYKYVWVDALCIIQDSVSDWLQESSKMCDYYSYSALTISANTTDTDTGFLKARNPLAKLPCWVVPKGRIPPIYIHQPTAVASGEIDPLKQLPLGHRSWVFQERLLAPRIIHFTDVEVFWECASTLRSDIFPNYPWDPARKRWLAHTSAEINQPEAAENYISGPGTFDFFMQRGLDPGLMDVTIWTEIIEEYSALSLSREEDKLVAIGGLARKAYKVTFGSLGRYFAGIWESALPLQLGWLTLPYFPDVFLSPRTTIYKAPSWSWASLNCRIMYRRYEKISEERMFELLDVHLEYALDEYGPLKNGWLRLRGSLLPVRLSRPEESNNPAHPDTYPRIYYDFPGSRSSAYESSDTEIQMDGNPVTEIPQPDGTIVYAFPIALYMSSIAGTLFHSLNALLLTPTGKKSGQYSRVGIMKIQLEAMEDFIQTYHGARPELSPELFHEHEIDPQKERLLPHEYTIEII